MIQFQPEEKTRLKRQRTAQAIALATQSRWEEAVTVNQSIIDLFPTDVDAFNRLGKALTELGRYAEARQAYSRALEADPNSSIAKKNLARLQTLKETTAEASVAQREKVDPRLFIEETGKTGFTMLHHLAEREVLAKMTAGDQVHLRANGRALVVENGRGQQLGQVEPKLALRLINLMRGGNKYAAAITSLDEVGVKVIIKEIHQDPSQAGRVSFPTKGPDTFRPYTRESLLRYDLEEEEEAAEEAEGGAEWEGETEGHHEEVEFFGVEEEAPVVAEKTDEFESW